MVEAEEEYLEQLEVNKRLLIDESFLYFQVNF